MLKQFYEKALPTQGVYCISGIDSNKKITNRFAETLEDVFVQIEKFKAKQCNTFVALGTFDGYSRKADDCLFVRSFFIDLDVGESKDYASKEDAHIALYKLVGETGLPNPVVIDSGGGIHAYWIMDEDIPKDVWKPAAEIFKTICLEHIAIDPVVTADAARIMRAPETFNHKFDPPVPTSVINDEIFVYSWQEFKLFLYGDVDKIIESPQSQESSDILASIPKGIDDDTKAFLKLDNFAKRFDVLAQKSVDNEGGCAQVDYMCRNVATLEEPLWRAGLSLAKFCDDGASAIHDFSNDHPEYNHAKTEEKASAIPAPRTCNWFIDNYPDRCKGCQHRGKITTPIQLAKVFVPAAAPTKEDSIWEEAPTKDIFEFPEFLFPYVKGSNGGIYFMPAPKVDKKGVKHQDDPILVLTSDLFPVVRMMSPHDGECLQMRLVLPKDGYRDFLLPMKHVYAKEAFKSIMSSNGVFFSSNVDQHLMNYVIKWGQYMQMTDKALQMRMQMGWTCERSDSKNWRTRHFVVGTREFLPDGSEVVAPSSHWIKGLSKHLRTEGTLERWRESMNYLNMPGFEMHAFAAFCGFGSPLMCYTTTTGVTVNLLGRSGCGKTGAMYAGLSLFGDPKDLSVVKATDNGFTQRYLGLHNMLFGLDEVGDKDQKELGQLIHNVSHGKAKIRSQASINAEREHEFPASMIALLTANHSLYGKLEALKGSPDGEAARLIELHVHRPKYLDQNARMGEHIFDAFRFNYGWAGPIYVKYIMKKGDDYVNQRLEFWKRKFEFDFGNHTEYRFYDNLIASNFAGAELAIEANLVEFDLERIYHEIVRELIMIRDHVVKVNKTDYESILGDYINKNLGNMLIMNENKVSMEPRGEIVGRIENGENLISVSKTHFKNYLAERKISTREFEFEMRKNGILPAIKPGQKDPDKKGRLGTGWKTTTPVYIYEFKMPIPESLFNGDTK